MATLKIRVTEFPIFCYLNHSGQHKPPMRSPDPTTENPSGSGMPGFPEGHDPIKSLKKRVDSPLKLAAHPPLFCRSLQPHEKRWAAFSPGSRHLTAISRGGCISSSHKGTLLDDLPLPVCWIIRKNIRQLFHEFFSRVIFLMIAGVFTRGQIHPV